MKINKYFEEMDWEGWMSTISGTDQRRVAVVDGLSVSFFFSFSTCLLLFFDFSIHFRSIVTLNSLIIIHGVFSSVPLVWCSDLLRFIANWIWNLDCRDANKSSNSDNQRSVSCLSTWLRTFSLFPSLFTATLIGLAYANLI